MSCAFVQKDPDATLNYGFKWTDWLGQNGDVIIGSMWIIPPGLNGSSMSFTGTTTTVWLSGGVIGQTYSVTNEITTAAGLIDDRTFYIECVQR